MQRFLGLDIGYSNVIGVYGHGDSEFQSFQGPAQAAPLNCLPGDAGLRAGEVIVSVGDTQWVAFASPGRVQEGRELHEDYTATDAYEALFKASLLHAAQEGDTIHRLVTGLPVNQARDENYVEQVRRRMLGRHKVSLKREINVEHVQVVAQPLGTLTDIYCNTEHGAVLEQSLTLVIDPGFFSVDWVVFDHQELVAKSSGSSLKAMSVLLDACNEEIAKDNGGVPGVEKIEHALQTGNDYIYLFGQKVILDNYLRLAADRVIPGVFTEIKQGLRFLRGRTVDCVVLGGGGANTYERFARNEFPESLVIRPENSVRSNADGFACLAKD